MQIIRKAILALALIAPAFAAFAQSPAPVYGQFAPGGSVAIYGSNFGGAPAGGVNPTITGQPFLGVNQGGTGVQTLPANSLLLGQGGTLPVGAITPFAPGQVLIDQGPGQTPQFRPISGAITINPQGIATLTGAGGGAGQIPGTATNDNASAGNIGEYISSTVAFGSPVSFVSGTPKDITSISLTAGDWDVMFEPNILLAATTNVTRIFASLSLTTNTATVAPGVFNEIPIPGGGFVNAAGPILGVPVGPFRFSLASTTTIFGNASCTFTVSTCGGSGVLRARRVR